MARILIILVFRYPLARAIAPALFRLSRCGTSPFHPVNPSKVRCRVLHCTIVAVRAAADANGAPSNGLRGKPVQYRRCPRNCNRIARRPVKPLVPDRSRRWEGGRRTMTREPGNLPMVVVPRPGGVYRAHAKRRANLAQRTSRHERHFRSWPGV